MCIRYLKKAGMSTIIVVDIDDCIANTLHRQHFARRGDMGRFFQECPNDPPILKNINDIKVYIDKHSDAQVWVISGRPMYVHTETEKWLNEHFLCDALFMRNSKVQPRAPDYIGGTSHKVRKVKQWLAAGHEILMIFDDQPHVVNALKALAPTTRVFNPERNYAGWLACLYP